MNTDHITPETLTKGIDQILSRVDLGRRGLAYVRRPDGGLFLTTFGVDNSGHINAIFGAIRIPPHKIDAFDAATAIARREMGGSIDG